jgi:hypothetical protein
LEADVELNPGQEQSSGWLGLIVVAGIAAVGVAISLAFLLAPKPAAETVRRIVQAAEALVTNAVPTPAVLEEKPLTLTKHWPRRAAPDVPGTSAPKPEGRLPVPVDLVPPARSEGSPSQNAELTPGTARSRVRELLGEPDLTLYKVEKSHVVEHFVYVHPVQNYASSVLLMDGRVASVYNGSPSVRGAASVSRISP